MSIPDEIFTERVCLRPPRESDAEQIFARYASDLEVSRYLSWLTHQTLDDTVEYLQRALDDIAAGTVVSRMVFERDSGRLLGAVGGGLQGHRVQFGYCKVRPPSASGRR